MSFYFIIILITCTVRPLFSGHVGTGAHPDKGFGRIWETQCLIHAAAYPMVSQCLNASYLEENLMWMYAYQSWESYVIHVSLCWNSDWVWNPPFPHNYCTHTKKITARSCPDNREIRIIGRPDKRGRTVYCSLWTATTFEWSKLLYWSLQVVMNRMHFLVCQISGWSDNPFIMVSTEF